MAARNGVNPRGQAKPGLLKVVLIGDGGVGKSSLMSRYVVNRFDSQCFHTIGVEFLNKDVMLDGRQWTLQIWDTAGQERFRSLRTPFYRGADACLLTYAVDDAQSFTNLSAWKQEFLHYSDVQDTANFPFIVIGNKCDLSDRAVPIDDVAAWCGRNSNVPYYETSAKDSTNVETAFLAAVKRVHELESKLDSQRQTHTDTVDLRGRRQGSTSGCC